MHGRSSGGARPTYVLPHWVRGLTLGTGAALLLGFAGRDMEGFPRASVLLALYLLVLATAADVIWHVWTCRKPSAVAALSGSRETVPCYSERLRLWVSSGAVGLAAATTALHGGDAMSVLRAWGELHRWAPPDIALRITPSAVSAHQPFHVTVTVDGGLAGRYRCEWQEPLGEWSSSANSCEIQGRAPLHFVEPAWPTRLVAVAAKVFDGDRLLGITPAETLTVRYAPMVELLADRARIIQGQKAEFSVRIDGHAPGADDRCRWTVGGEFASSERCTLSYTGKELTSSPSTTVQVAVEVENTANRSTGTAHAALAVEQPPRYTVYLVDASRRMAQQTSTGTLLETVKNDLVDGLSNTDLGKDYLGVATFGEDGSHPLCSQNVQVPYPVQPVHLNEVKSVLYLLQPVAFDAPFFSALLKGLMLLRPYAEPAAQHASFALVSIAAGLDTCAGARPDDGLRALDAVLNGVRAMTRRLDGRLLTLTIGIGATDRDKRQWIALAKFAPTKSPFVILPTADIVTLHQALKAVAQLGSRDYDARLDACADLVRILRTRSLDAGAGQVERYCRTLSIP
jgi:hypothetical protein